MENVLKVAVLPIVSKKLFVCRKKGLNFLVNLGGRLEAGETDEQCAIRETEEEARCRVTNLKFFTTVKAPRGDIPGEIEMRCYFGDLVGEPKINPEDNIYEFVWIGRDWKEKGYVLPPSMTIVVNMLIRQGYL